MTKPNLFLIGAPRCGTTAMSRYLGDHPNVYVPKLKEPHFFATDFPAVRKIDNLAQYERSYRAAEEHHTVIVDASVHYMYSSVAVDSIFEFNPDARLLVMLRNPVDMLYSMHARSLATFTEEESDFENAWRRQSRRDWTEHLPKGCRTPAFREYRKMACLGAQLNRVLEIFPRDQVCTILFDDFRDDPKAAYNKVLAFAGVAADGRTEFPTINENIQSFRLKWLAERLRHPPKPVRRIEKLVKKGLKVERFGAVAAAEKVLGKREARTPLSTGFRTELIKEFRDDIRQLSGLVDRDLSYWH